MTSDNIVTIKGCSYENAKKALKQWMDLYKDSLPSDAEFKLYQNGRANHVIEVDERIDNESFNYLVNYLKYPEGIEYHAEIEGFTTVRDEQLFKTELLNKKILVYVANNDSEGDNVFAVTEDNQGFKIDFRGAVTRISDPKGYTSPDLDLITSPENIKLTRQGTQGRFKESQPIGKRFKIVALITLGLTVTSFLTLLINDASFFKTTLFLGIAIGVWFLSDYKMLQIDRYYFYSLIVSVLFLAYGVLIQQLFLSSNLKLMDLGSLGPLSLLIVQKPLRYLFKAALNREPVVDRPPPTFWDGVYTVILFASFVALPFFRV